MSELETERKEDVFSYVLFETDRARRGGFSEEGCRLAGERAFAKATGTDAMGLLEFAEWRRNKAKAEASVARMELEEVRRAAAHGLVRAKWTRGKPSPGTVSSHAASHPQKYCFVGLWAWRLRWYEERGLATLGVRSDGSVWMRDGDPDISHPDLEWCRLTADGDQVLE